ncbi:MAG: ferredoxin [Pseudomonadota bacterium]
MDLERTLRAEGLSIAGHFEPGPDDGAPQDVATLVLLGPGIPGFWDRFRASKEYSDGKPDPIDRWSHRVISDLAETLEAQAFFPFGGQPWQPFIQWARLGERARQSPVAMQISPHRGLWMSYRGALGFKTRLDLPALPQVNPCAGCPAPCLGACPVSAISDGVYDVPTCVAHIGGAGQDCLDGCKVRLACPVGQAPPLGQRRMHMQAFLSAQLEV